MVIARPKHIYVRSALLLYRVGLLPCMVTGIYGQTQPAHSNWAEHGKGKGIKADDNRVAAIAWWIHRELDQGTHWSATQRRQLWWTAHCSTVLYMWRHGLWPHDVPLPNLTDFDP